MVAFEDFEETLAATFANELGYADETASGHDSVHVASQAGGRIEGNDGDNLFILNDGVDQVRFSRGFNNNDEGKHVNIVHGFDLAEDVLRFDTDYKGLFTIGATTNNGKAAAFEGAPGIASLLSTVSTVSNVDDNDGNLHFDIKLKGGDPMTIVLTDTTLQDVYESAYDQVYRALLDSGVASQADVQEWIDRDGGPALRIRSSRRGIGAEETIPAMTAMTC